jgi:hypothetical protein
MFFLTDKHFLNLNAYAKPCLVDPWYIPCSLDGAYGHCLDNPQTAIRYAFNRAGTRLFRLYSYRAVYSTLFDRQIAARKLA